MQEPLATKNSQRFTDLFLEIERRVDVNAIAIDGVQLWPLMRARLRKPFKELTQQPLSAPRPEPYPAVSAGHSPDGWRRWLRYVGWATAADARTADTRHAGPPVPAAGVAARAAVPAAEQIERTVSSQVERIAKLGHYDYVVFSRPNKYYQRLGGKRYAPILDPVLEDLGRRGRALMLCECTQLDFECVNPPVTYDTTPQMELRRYLPKADYTAVIAQMDAVQAIVAELEPEFRVEPRKVLFRYTSHYLRKEFYLRLLAALQPRVAFFSSLTSWVPVIWAGRELGIPTVDIQHGGQSSHHGFNTHYSRIPADGYWLLPDFFWCWGRQNQEIVQRWFPGGANRHLPLVGGNRWKAKWVGAAGQALLSAEQKAFLGSLTTRRPAILVTLSHGVDELLPDCLLQAMRRKRAWYWLIRMHPINRSAEVELRLRQRLDGLEIDNYEIDFATDIPLHALLQHVHYHLSPFSTAAREAVDFGVPTTIIDPIGKVDFADDIAAGTFSYADDVDTLCQQIEAEISLDQKRETGSLLATDESYVDAVLDRIEQWRRQPGATPPVRRRG